MSGTRPDVLTRIMLFFAKPIGVSSGFRAKGLNLRKICDSGAVENLYNFE
jgi:hypothetical protein